MSVKYQAKLLASILFVVSLSGCADPGGSAMGTGETGAVQDDMDTHGSGAMNGFAAENGDPIAGSGNLGSASTESDPMNGSNQMGPMVPF